MTESHLILASLVFASLALMGLVNVVPKKWTEEKAKKDLADILNRDTSKGIFK